MSRLIGMSNAAWKRQPNWPVEINGASGLSKNMEFLLAGNSRYDVVGRRFNSAVGGTVAAVSGRFGVAHKFSSASTYLEYDHTAKTEVLGALTLAFIGAFAGSCRVVSKAAADGTNNPYRTSIESTMNGLYFIRAGSSAYRSFKPDTNLGTAGGIYVITAEDGMVQSVPNFYFNGKKYGAVQAYTTGTNQSVSGTSAPLRVGNWDTGAECNLSLVAVVSRAWSYAEALAFCENPWQLFRPRPALKIFIPAAAGGGTYNLVSAINSLSSTSNSALSVIRALTSALASDSLSPAAALLVQRALVTAFNSTSYAPDTVTLSISGLIALVTALASTSTTSDGSLSVQRSLIGTLASDSTTSSAAVNVTRSLTTALGSTSLTPDALANVVRAIATALSSASTTADTITLNTSTVIALVTAIASGSLTPDAGIAIARALASVVASDSTTAAPSVAVVRPQTTAIASLSSTSTPALDLLALLQIASSISSASTTGDASLTVARAIANQIASLSETATPSLDALRQLATALVSASSTSQPNLAMAGDVIVALTTLIASQSLTSNRVRLLTDLVAAIETALHVRVVTTQPTMTATGQPATMTVSDIQTN